MAPEPPLCPRDSLWFHSEGKRSKIASALYFPPQDHTYAYFRKKKIMEIHGEILLSVQMVFV